MWLKITDIFQECSFDYDKDSTMANNFYAAVQNKMHYAVTGHTAAEIVQGRSDPSKPNMGLTSWKGGPEGRSTPRTSPWPRTTCPRTRSGS